MGGGAFDGGDVEFKKEEVSRAGGVALGGGLGCGMIRGVL